jgi:hypothetical protein
MRVAARLGSFRNFTFLAAAERLTGRLVVALDRIRRGWQFGVRVGVATAARAMICDEAKDVLTCSVWSCGYTHTDDSRQNGNPG